MDFIILTLFNFIIYSFIGWVIENVYCYYTEGHFQEHGFLYGAYKPMYGISMVILIGFSSLINYKIVMLLLCLIVTSIVEYLSGYILKFGFNKQYWDYSKLKNNFQGLICLKFSIYWMFLSFIGVYYFQPLVNFVFWEYSGLFIVLIPFVTAWFLLDLFFTVSNFDRKSLFNLVFKRAKT